MDLIKKLIELVYYYRKDQGEGKAYWKDPTVIGLAVSLIGTALIKWAGVNLDSDLQLKIVGVLTGIGALLSPHTGIVAKPVQPLPTNFNVTAGAALPPGTPKQQTAAKEEPFNLTNVS